LPGLANTVNRGITALAGKRIANFPPILYTYALLTVGLFSAAILTVLIRRTILHESFPYNTFLFDPQVRFSDFSFFRSRFEYFGQEKFFADTGFLGADTPFNYPPFMALILWGWYRISGDGASWYIALIILVAISFAGLLVRALRKSGVASGPACLIGCVMLLTSYPVMILIDRLNLEGLAWILVSIGMIAFVRGRPWLAAACFGVAASLKIFPIVLLGVFPAQGKWREFAFGMLIAAGLTLGCLWFMGPSVGWAWNATLTQQKLLYVPYVLHERGPEYGFQHSLFFLIRQALSVFWHGRADVIGKAYRIYLPLSPVLGLLLYLRIHKLPVLNQLIALSVCAVWLPWWSGDYTLVHLYVPWALLVLWVINRPSTISAITLLWFLAPFLILFTPQPFLVFHGQPWGGQAKAVALMILLGSSLLIPLSGGLADLAQPPVGLAENEDFSMTEAQLQRNF